MLSLLLVKNKLNVFTTPANRWFELKSHSSYFKNTFWILLSGPICERNKLSYVTVAMMIPRAWSGTLKHHNE